jgi:murein DD-endopeptidase MepM/ murein hydrolase activator NlpD
VSLAAALLPLALHAAAGVAVEATPHSVRPGDAFLVVVRGTDSPPSATVAGRPLSFFQLRHGFGAVAALPVETAPGPLSFTVSVPGPDGAALRLLPAEVEVVEPRFPERALVVEPRFVEPPPPALQQRIDEDRAAFARAYARPPGPPLFSAPFTLPRRDRVTAGFGEQRTLNGVKPSQHYGLDLAGPIGARVAASNAGEVVLVRDCWASGRTVILWHGAGLFTSYFHLSRALVNEGAHVARGEAIGRVGRSGRASGPHLHWSVRVGDLYVDPLSVLRLPLGAGERAAATSTPRRGPRRAPP